MVMTVERTQFREFLEDEMRKREMSIRQFAEFVGVSHPTITRAIDPSGSVEPSFDFLVKLSEATKVDLCTIVALLAPDRTHISARARVLAQAIEALSEGDQEIIDNFLIGATSKTHKKAT